jgi:hypothetical protein
MKKFKRLTVSDNEYYRMIEIQLFNKNKFKEHLIGSRKRLIVFGKDIATVKPTTQFDLGMIREIDFITFIARFNKQLYRQFVKNNNLYNINIPFSGMARHKNKKRWLELRNEELFYNVDLNSAYWQIAYRLGYLDEKFYRTYLNRYSHKKAKRYCITFLVRKNEMVYHNGKKIHKITCDNEVFKQMYKNIRHELYNTIHGCLALIGDDYIEFNIDGISVCKRHLQTIKEYFDSIGLDFKTSLCIKKNASEYVSGSKCRVFTKAPVQWALDNAVADVIEPKNDQNVVENDVYIGDETPTKGQELKVQTPKKINKRQKKGVQGTNVSGSIDKK